MLRQKGFRNTFSYFTQNFVCFADSQLRFDIIIQRCTTICGERLQITNVFQHIFQMIPRRFFHSGTTSRITRCLNRGRIPA